MSQESDLRDIIIACNAQILALVSGGVASYARPGLSITKMSLRDIQQIKRDAEAELAGTKHGFFTIGDFSGRAPDYPEAEQQS